LEKGEACLPTSARDNARDPPAPPQLTKHQTKKSRPEGRLSFSNRAENYLAADAAAEAAVDAAAEAAVAASAATEAAEAATAAAVAASAAAGAGVASTAGAGAATGASTTGGVTTASGSFLAQAARATASRETISKDFFMGFSLINSLNYNF
jgi:hypothetical protein